MKSLAQGRMEFQWSISSKCYSKISLDDKLKNKVWTLGIAKCNI
jgi:hypothetical protein